MKKINIKGLNETIYKKTFPCGLDLYMWPDHKEKKTKASLIVKYGSIHQKFKINNKEYNVPTGIAHFLEHLKFNINETEKAEDLFSELGTMFNAYTTFDHTNYYVTFRDNLEKNINHLLNYVYNGYFTDELVEKEKGIILEELKMGNDNIFETFSYSIYELLFHNKSYKTKIIGLEEDIKKTTINDVELVYNNFYHPKNMFMVVTGDFEIEKLIKVIESNLKNKTFNIYNNPEIIAAEEPLEVYGKYKKLILNSGVDKARLALKVKSSYLEPLNDLEKHEYLKMICSTNFSKTSKLNYNLRVKNIVQITNAYVIQYPDYFIIHVVFEGDKISKGIKVIRKRLKNLKITKKDFIRKKRARIASIITSFDNYSEVHNIITDEILLYNKLNQNMKELTENSSFEKAKYVLKKMPKKNISIVVIKDK